VAALLAQVELFADLPREELTRLAASLRILRYPAGMLLFLEGEVGDRMFIVLAGGVAIIKALGTPDERLLNVRRQGEFIGEMSLLTGEGLRTASARVEDETTALELDAAEFRTLVSSTPSLAHKMLQVLSRRLRDSHDHTVRDLHEKNERLAAAYAELQAAQAQIIAQETLLRELRVARGIQESMLPHSLPQLGGVDLGARMLSARDVGGDFYDFYPLPDGRLVISIGDVSGKGVPAALFMALACSLLRAEAARGSEPGAALEQLNRHMVERGARGMFITAIYGILDPATRHLSYVRAGHEYPFVWDAQGKPLHIEPGRSLPLGLFPTSMLEAQAITLPPGATVLLFTDGMTEARDGDQTLFGHERLAAAAHGLGWATAQELCTSLIDAVQAHQGDAPQADDLTIVALRLT
jgi:sigma-B regulation protein RsbU (phosphoserine phosphatase)